MYKVKENKNDLFPKKNVLPKNNRTYQQESNEYDQINQNQITGNSEKHIQSKFAKKSNQIITKQNPNNIENDNLNKNYSLPHLDMKAKGKEDNYYQTPQTEKITKKKVIGVKNDSVKQQVPANNQKKIGFQPSQKPKNFNQNFMIEKQNNLLNVSPPANIHQQKLVQAKGNQKQNNLNPNILSDKLVKNRFIIQPVENPPVIFYNDDEVLKIYEEVDKTQKQVAKNLKQQKIIEERKNESYNHNKNNNKHQANELHQQKQNNLIQQNQRANKLDNSNNQGNIFNNNYSSNIIHNNNFQKGDKPKIQQKRQVSYDDENNNFENNDSNNYQRGQQRKRRPSTPFYSEDPDQLQIQQGIQQHSKPQNAKQQPSKVQNQSQAAKLIKKNKSQDSLKINVVQPNNKQGNTFGDSTHKYSMNQFSLSFDQDFQTYDPSCGFVIKFDYITKFPQNFSSFEIKYSIYRKNSQLLYQGQTETYETNDQASIILGDKEVVLDIRPEFNTYLYLEINALVKNSNQVTQAWSIVQLFNENYQLQEGFHKLPFYSYDLTPSMLFTQKIPYINNMTLQMRICSSSNFKINNENNLPISRYNFQAIHQSSNKNYKSNKTIEQSEQKKMEVEIENFLSRSMCDKNNDLLWKYSIAEMNNLKSKIKKKQEVFESYQSISLPAIRSNPAFERIIKPFNKNVEESLGRAQAPIGHHLFKEDAKIQKQKQRQEAQYEVKEKINRQKQQISKQDPNIRLQYLEQQEQELTKSLVLVKNTHLNNTHIQNKLAELQQQIETLGQLSIQIEKIVNYPNKQRIILDIVIMQGNSFVLDSQGQAILMTMLLPPNNKGEVLVNQQINQVIDHTRIKPKDIDSLYIRFMVSQASNQLEDVLFGWGYQPLFLKKENFEKGQRQTSHQLNQGSFNCQLREQPIQKYPFNLAITKRRSECILFTIQTQNNQALNQQQQITHQNEGKPKKK